MHISQEQITVFQEEILFWYSEHKRALPWRRDRDPYHILVSEVMLQQTQVGRVIPKYEAWLKAFPTIDALATASKRDVLQLWSGLGYNRRALYLREVAKIIVEKLGGVFPREINALKTLPGVGEYTAYAVACFAFDQQVAVVDTNIRRVILTQFPMSNFKSQMSNEKQIQSIADQLLPIGKASEWNQALMDYSVVMLMDKKVPITKQSKFYGSDRYYRGKIIKLLIEKQKIKIHELGPMIKQEFTPIDMKWLMIILKNLARDNLIILVEDEAQLS